MVRRHRREARHHVSGGQPPVDRPPAGRPATDLRPSEARESLHDAEDDAPSAIGPVIANGFEGGYGWVLRGCIGKDGAWSWFESDRGGRRWGRWPQHDPSRTRLAAAGPRRPALRRRGRFFHGLRLPAAAAVAVRWPRRQLPARIVDIGDRRASFFVASWPSGGWRTPVAGTLPARNSRPSQTAETGVGARSRGGFEQQMAFEANRQPRPWSGDRPQRAPADIVLHARPPLG